MNDDSGMKQQPDNGQQPDAGQQEEILNKLLIENTRLKQSSAMIMIGMRLVHYGLARTGDQIMRDERLKDCREQAATLMEKLTERMRDLAQEPFDSAIMNQNLHDTIRWVGKDLEEARKGAGKKRTQELKEGIQTPFEALDRQLVGGIKAGQVVFVTGESEAVFVTLAGFYRHFPERRVPITYFGTAEASKMLEVPGVRNVPGIFWRARGMERDKINEVFKAADGYIAIVDRLDWLLDPTDGRSMKRKRQLVLKNLVKVAARYGIGIIVGHVADAKDEPVPPVENVMVLPVCARKLNDQPVFMAGDTIFTEGPNGLLCVLGNSNAAAPGVEGPDGRSANSQQLEGPGKDPAEGGGVGSDSAGTEPGISAGQGG